MNRGAAICLALWAMLGCVCGENQPVPGDGPEIYVGTPRNPEKWPYRYTLVRSGKAWSGEMEIVMNGKSLLFASFEMKPSKEKGLTFEAPIGAPGKMLPASWELKMTAVQNGYDGILTSPNMPGSDPVSLSFVRSPGTPLPSTVLEGKPNDTDAALYRSEAALRREIQVAKAAWTQEKKVAARIAELRSDDQMRGGVLREWIGPLWAHERLDPESTKYFERICAVYLGGTAVTDKDVEAIGSLVELRELYLHRTNITDVSLANISKLGSLQVLHLRNTRVTDQGLEKLKALSNLQELYLIETRVTEAGVQRLRKALPHAKILR